MRCQHCGKLLNKQSKCTNLSEVLLLMANTARVLNLESTYSTCNNSRAENRAWTLPWAETRHIGDLWQKNRTSSLDEMVDQRHVCNNTNANPMYKYDWHCCRRGVRRNRSVMPVPIDRCVFFIQISCMIIICHWADTPSFETSIFQHHAKRKFRCTQNEQMKTQRICRYT